MGYCKWLVGVVCLAAAGPARGAPPGYVEPSTCAVCHSKIAADFAKTGMARTFRSANQGNLSELQSLDLDHQASAEHFSALELNGRQYVRRDAVKGREKEIDAFEERIDYLIGSGDQSVSYLHRTADGQLTQFPVSWYTSEGRWAMSPGFDRPDHSGFSRAITYRCMFCHNAYPDVAEGAGNWDGATVFPAKLPEGIDCQRCHGPGSDHVAAARQGKGPKEIQAAIVNPARLTPQRENEICLQCHLETTSMQLPGSIMRFGLSVFSYRAGQPLSDYILYFDHAPGTGYDDKFEFVSAPYRLRKSACFTASEGRLTCTTCHDPHQEPSPEELQQRTDRACLKCHESRIAALVSRSAHTESRDCATCHMPRRQSQDAIHVSVGDHWIQRPPKSAAAAPAFERNDGNTLPYAGEVAPYYPKTVDPLYAAVAQVNGLANLSAGLANLDKLLAELRPKEAAPYFEMGEALASSGQARKSIAFYERAAEIEPRDWRYLFSLGQAQKAAGVDGRGVAAMERAAALAPYETSLREAVGVAYALAGRTAEALRTLREALSRNPDDGAAQNNLGQVLAQTGDLRGATAALREAVRIQPEVAQFRMNLADVLMQTAQFRDAADQVAAVIRMGPSTLVARSAWFSELAAGGNTQQARLRYEDSLRKQAAEFHDNLGTALISSGDSEAAIREYRAAIDSDPRSAAAALNLGLTLAGHNQPAEARRWLEEALRLDPHRPEAHLVLGQLLLRAGLTAEGTAHLKIAATDGGERIRAAAQRLLNSGH